MKAEVQNAIEKLNKADMRFYDLSKECDSKIELNTMRLQDIDLRAKELSIKLQ